MATDPTPQQTPAQDSATVAAPATVLLVPHTHWDREWYEPFEGFLARLVEMMDGLIGLMDREPRFAHFHLDGQAAMIEDYLAVRPERLPDVERLAAAGRISVGPWFTQMDEFLVSGESIVRNLEWGLARAERFGYEGIPIGYLPDQFGHIGQMPQILRRGGVEQAVVWRGVPMAVGKTAFWWESPDGSRVLTEYLAFGYSVGWWLAQSKDAEELARYLGQAVEWLQPYASRETLLVTVGGDHHVPAAKLPPLIEAVNAAPGAPVQARMASLQDSLEESPAAEDLPAWRGELRSSARAHLLPNVYSARIHQKLERAEVEALVERWAEPLAALVEGAEWPEEPLTEAWRRLLWNGAHDSVCGCSVDAVAAAVDARFADARRWAGDVVDHALERLAGRMSKPGWMYVNPSPFERDGVPGLGWLVGPDDPDQGPVPFHPPLELLTDGSWIRAGDLELRLVDQGDVGDLYNFCPTPAAPPIEPSSFETNGETLVASFDHGLRVELRAERHPDGSYVYLRGRIVNGRPDHRLRLHVALPGPASGSTALSPFEAVERPVEAEGGTETASRTWPARGAVMAAGRAVFQEGVFEYEILEDPPEVAVTILRCVGTISRPEIATRAWAAGPDIPTPEAQMLGAYRFWFAIQDGLRAEDMPSAWERTMLPIRAVRSEGGGDLPERGSLLEVEGAELSSVRRVDGRLEVRIWNPSSRPRKARVGERSVDLGPAEIATVRLDR